jgi:hypothetical protein
MGTKKVTSRNKSKGKVSEIAKVRLRRSARRNWRAKLPSTTVMDWAIAISSLTAY